MKAENLFAAGPGVRQVLHYTGADDDRGGVMSVVRALAEAERFGCVLGVNPGFTQRRTPALPILELPRIEGEAIGASTIWRARAVARDVRAWLAADAFRVFHGHSRAGMLVAWWLGRRGERRVVASVHCYGRQRWFYRWMARQLGGRLFWLSPAMKRYYGVGDGSWAQCIPGCISAPRATGNPRRRPENPAALHLGGVGAVVRWKGWHYVVAAIAALPRAVRDQIRFTHIGGPDGSADSQSYTAELHAMTMSQGLDGNIAWRGVQASAEELLTEIDCLVVASEHEPFSIAVLEALAAGVPILAADSGGASDLLVPGQTGWFFRTGDVPDLCRGIAALSQPETWARVAIPPEVVERFAAPAIAERWEQVYAAL